MIARAGMLAVVALAVAVPALAATPQFVIYGDRTVAGVAIGRGTLADARGRFGSPSVVRKRSRYECVATWRRIGLTLSLLDLSQRNACNRGVVASATVTRRPAWRTALGLRVGDSVARLRSLYPRARLHRRSGIWSGYWLIPRRACETVGSAPYPGLLARVRAGRVRSIVAATHACE